VVTAVRTARFKRDCTCAETRFGFSAKRTRPFKFASGVGGRLSRLLAAEVCASAVVMVVMLDTPCFEVQCKTTGYPLHSHVSPSLPLPCVTVCHQVSTELYHDVRTAPKAIPAIHYSRSLPHSTPHRLKAGAITIRNENKEDFREQIFHTVQEAQLVEAMRYKSGGHGFDFKWSHWDFSFGKLSAKRTSPFKFAGGGGSSSVDYWQPRCAHQRY